MDLDGTIPMDVDEPTATEEVTLLPMNFQDAPESRDRRGFDSRRARALNIVPSSLNRYLRHESLENMIDTCQSIFKDWRLLQHKIALPHHTYTSDDHVLDAFRAVDNMITNKPGRTLLSRLACVQLIQLFSSIEAIVKQERKMGLIDRVAGQGNTSIALNMYMRAKKGASRRSLLERKRLATRWKILAGPSPLLLLIYSEAAVRVVQDFWAVDNKALRRLAGMILQNCPHRVIQLCIYLTKEVDAVVNSNTSGPDWMRSNALLESPGVRLITMKQTTGRDGRNPGS